MQYESLTTILVNIGPNSILTRCKLFPRNFNSYFLSQRYKRVEIQLLLCDTFFCLQERVRAANLWRPLECKGVPNKTQSSNKSAKAMGKNSPSPPTHQGSEKSTKLQIILNQSAKRSRTRLKRVIIFFWPKNIYIGLRLDQSTQK